MDWNTVWSLIDPKLLIVVAVVLGNELRLVHVNVSPLPTVL